MCYLSIRPFVYPLICRSGLHSHKLEQCKDETPAKNYILGQSWLTHNTFVWEKWSQFRLGAYTCWCWLEDYFIVMLPPFRNTCYCTSNYLAVVRLAVVNNNNQTYLLQRPIQSRCTIKPFTPKDIKKILWILKSSFKKTCLQKRQSVPQTWATLNAQSP